MLNKEALLNSEEKLYSIPQIASLSKFNELGLNFHRATVWRWVKEGKIPSHVINGRNYLKLSDYEKFLRGEDGNE